MNKTIIIAVALSVGLSVASMTIVQRFFNNDKQKIAVVDAIKLFNEFGMKKELEAKEKVKLEAMSKQVDSMENSLNLAKASKNEEEIKKASYAAAYMKNAFQSTYEESNRAINEQIWKRLNPMIDEFGKKKGVHLIIGANGMGSVLYNDEYYDLTNEAIKYINKKYEEGN